VEPHDETNNFWLYRFDFFEELELTQLGNCDTLLGICHQHLLDSLHGFDGYIAGKDVKAFDYLFVELLGGLFLERERTADHSIENDA
jgi:hypothetical protein